MGDSHVSRARCPTHTLISPIPNAIFSIYRDKVPSIWGRDSSVKIPFACTVRALLIGEAIFPIGPRVKREVAPRAVMAIPVRKGWILPFI